MKVYAVRQKSTRLFIPCVKTTGQQRAGYFLEPSSEREPYIFRSSKAAELFLRKWLNRPINPHINAFLYKQEDMEIVEFNCIEIIK